jgi:phage terminase large subunit-like protein
MRTMTTDGIVYLTLTPLQGVTPLVLAFMHDAGALPGGLRDSDA